MGPNVDSQKLPPTTWAGRVTTDGDRTLNEDVRLPLTADNMQNTQAKGLSVPRRLNHWMTELEMACEPRPFGGSLGPSQDPKGFLTQTELTELLPPCVFWGEQPIFSFLLPNPHLGMWFHVNRKRGGKGNRCCLSQGTSLLRGERSTGNYHPEKWDKPTERGMDRKVHFVVISLIVCNQRKGKKMEFGFQNSALLNCYLQNTSNILIIFNSTQLSRQWRHNRINRDLVNI